MITGGTKGLGRAIALSFAREGAWVGLNYFSDDETALRFQAEIIHMDVPTILFKADVSSQSDVSKMVSSFLEQWGRIDILVNNAGIIRDKMLLFLNQNDWDRVLDVNLKSVYLCCRAFLKSMISQRYGRIINITSPSALMGRVGQTNYAASKGGIISFTKSLSREVSRLGITVNAVCPGVISTSMTEELSEKTMKDLLNLIPMGKFGESDDVAAAVLFLASEQARYITSQVLSIDGGLT